MKRKSKMRFIRNVALAALVSGQAFVPALADPSRVETEAYIEGFVQKYSSCNGSLGDHRTTISVANGTLEIIDLRDMELTVKSQISVLDIGGIEVILPHGAANCVAVYMSCSGGGACVREDLSYNDKVSGLVHESKTWSFVSIDTSASPEAVEKLVRAIEHYNSLYGGVLAGGFKEDTF